jgi:uncharacterized phage protein (TIGR02218 family)
MADQLQATDLKVSYAYINWILQTNRAIVGHLYWFTSSTGINDYFTDLDVNVSWNNQTWKSQSLRFEGLQRKVGIGLSVDEQTLKIWSWGNTAGATADTLFGANFLTGAEEGLLDGAVIRRFRIVWQFTSGNVAQDVATTLPIAVWPLFTGYMSQVEKGGISHIECKVKSALVRLTTNMPRNYFQPGCLWTLYDSGCTLVKASFAVTGTVGSGGDAITIPVSGGVPSPLGADGIANYAQGRLDFTSGVNSGLQVLMDTNDTTNIYLAYPLNALPSPGDGITFYPGCSKAFKTCDTKFSNKANFRGFDKVPPVVISA